jgi:hypothetical protein
MPFSDFDTDDSDLNTESDDDTESSGFWSKGCKYEIDLQPYIKDTEAYNVIVLKTRCQLPSMAD